MPNSKKILPLVITFTTIGSLFCLWNIYGSAETICLTNGCSLFQDFSFAGISLWQVGLVFFLILLLAGLLAWNNLGLIVATLGVLADIFLLILMIFSAPCTNCLIVAFILACTYLSFLHVYKQNSYKSLNSHKNQISRLILIWSIFFIANLGVLMQNSSETWAMLAPDKLEDSQIHVYFSPSCSACIELVDSLGQDQVLHDPKAIVAWYPVEEKAGDIFIINAMRKELANGHSLSKSLEYAKKDSQNTYTFQTFLLQLQLWINKVAVLNAGSDKLPLVQYHGLPRHLTKDARISQSIKIQEPIMANGGLTGLSGGMSGENFQDGVVGFCADNDSDC